MNWKDSSGKYFSEKGIIRENYENGQIKSKGRYVNGEKNGYYIEYLELPDQFEELHVASKGIYVNGEKNGEWITYYENGQLNQAPF